MDLHTLRARAVAFAALACALPALASAPDAALAHRIDAVSVPFVANAGQWHDRAAFAAQTFAGTLFVTRDGQLVYRLAGKRIADTTGATGEPCGVALKPRCNARTAGWVLSETLIDRQGTPRTLADGTLRGPAGHNRLPGTVGYLVADSAAFPAAARGTARLDSYERLSLGEVYPGIDLQLRATGRNVEKIFTVAAHQDPAQIAVRLDGAERLEIGAQGELIAHTGNGPVSFTAPVAFQQSASGERSAVSVAYALDAGERRYGFALGAYDRERPLVIDPLLQSTYHGGAGGDSVTAIAIHPQTGEVYVTGQTDSTDLPGVTPGSGGIATGAITAYGGSTDGYVARFNAALTTRLQTTYFGGTGYEIGVTLAIHPLSGDVYVAGGTNSTALPGLTPGTGGISTGAQTTPAPSYVARLNAALTSVLQSTFVGGNNGTDLKSLAIHPISGDIYVSGNTTSTNLPFATGGAQPTRTGSQSAFVMRLAASLTTIVQSTYHNGTGAEDGAVLAIHPFSGDIYLAGAAGSSNLPGTAGGAQAVKAAGTDAYVTRFNEALSSRLQSTFNGGTGNDVATGIAIHPYTGDVYVAGITGSSDLPATAGGAQAATAGAGELFVTRFTASLISRLQSTYFGGGADELSYASLAVHPVTGDVFLAGGSTSASLPGLGNGWQAAKAPGYDAFVTRINPALTTALQTTFLGGGGDDFAFGLGFDAASGQVYVAGRTASGDLPLAGGGAQPAKALSEEGFVSRISFDLRAGDAVPDAFVFTPKLNVQPASLQTSNPVLITGISAPVPISVVAAPGTLAAQYCVANTPDCTLCDVLPYGSSAGSISNNQYACARQLAPALVPGLARATLLVGGGFGHFLVGTGAQITSCNLDIDGSGGAPNAQSDGLMLVRAMLGFTGSAVTAGAIVGTPPRNTWTLIREYLNANCGTSFAP